MQLSSEQAQFLQDVGRLWGSGMTQEQVAQALDKPLSTVRSRLRYYGYRFGRNGRLVPVIPIPDSARGDAAA